MDNGEKTLAHRQMYYRGHGYVTWITRYRNGTIVRVVGISRVNDVFAPRTGKRGGMFTLDLKITSFTRSV